MAQSNVGSYSNPLKKFKFVNLIRARKRILMSAADLCFSVNKAVRTQFLFWDMGQLTYPSSRQDLTNYEVHVRLL